MNLENFWSGSQMVDLVFQKLHMTENAVGVPYNLLYVQKVFKRYTLT